MHFLFVDYHYPMPDRASADVRILSIVRLLKAQGHECDYFATDIEAAVSRVGMDEIARYRKQLQEIGVGTIERKGIGNILGTRHYDVVYFHYFYPAESCINLVRIWQPQARIVVDSVDLVYARLAAKARTSGLAADRVAADDTKRRELATYFAADMVITVTDDEARTLAGELPGAHIHVIPNIHVIPDIFRRESDSPSLVFIGTFTHEPNVDGILWFAQEVWPRIRLPFPDAVLRVIGGSVPDRIRALAGNGIEVLGYVPDTLAYLSQSWVSVAPLRFGAGLKGKVGEAMAAGLPVVTTDFGAEGFGLSHGEHALVATDSVSFADAVCGLLADRARRDHLGKAGKLFIQERYSPDAVQRRLELLCDALQSVMPKRVLMAGVRRSYLKFSHWSARNLIWRFRPFPKQ